jgi:hypothetical protein
MSDQKPADRGWPVALTPRLTLAASDGRRKIEPDAGGPVLTDYEAATQLIEHLRQLRDKLGPTSALRVDLITLLARLERYRLVT